MKKVCLFMLILIVLSGCRGWRSDKPPVHLNPNMDFQASIRPQENPAEIPDHVVPWGPEEAFSDKAIRHSILKTKNKPYYLGKNAQGQWVDKIPVVVNKALLSRGRERFDIYCSMCHGNDGSGNGIVMDYGWFKPQPYWAEHIVSYKDGQLFDIISHGIRTMPGYAQQIPENDRWAIVSYIRALQSSQAMSLLDVPDDVRKKLNRQRK